MQHVAIDLGGQESQICIRAADGTIIEEKRHATRQIGKLMEKWAPSRVILETSAEAFRVADAARQQDTKCGSRRTNFGARERFVLDTTSTT